MSQFAAPDLARLPTLPLTTPEFEATLAARMADFKARAEADGFDYDVGALESDPIRIDQEVGADREIGIHARINDQTRAVMLATAWGAWLDHIATTFYGISRLVLSMDEGTGEVTHESDDDFRIRIALVPEAFSTAGPEGAYAFHALELDGRQSISYVAVYSEEDGAIYDDGTRCLHRKSMSSSCRIRTMPAPIRRSWSLKHEQPLKPTWPAAAVSARPPSASAWAER